MESAQTTIYNGRVEQIYEIRDVGVFGSRDGFVGCDTMHEETKKIDGVIADGVWYECKLDGKVKLYRITIGKPRKDTSDPRGDWYCPIEIEKFTQGIILVRGVGSLDCLINTMNFLRSFFDTCVIAPGLADPRKK